MDIGLKLEIAKLVVQALTPIAVGYLGWKFSKRLKDLEQVQWGNRKLTEKRIQIYEKTAPLINRLYCYYSYVGDWQNQSPRDIIVVKRELDHEMYVNKYLLEGDVFEAYQEFMDALFDVFTGVGRDAKLKTCVLSHHGDRRKSPHFTWEPEFADCFSANQQAPQPMLDALYDSVMVAQRRGIKT